MNEILFNGYPQKLFKNQVQELVNKGYSYSKIANELKSDPSNVRKFIKRHYIKPTTPTPLEILIKGDHKIDKIDTKYAMIRAIKTVKVFNQDDRVYTPVKAALNVSDIEWNQCWNQIINDILIRL